MRKKPRSYKTGVLPQTAFYVEELRGKVVHVVYFCRGSKREATGDGVAQRRTSPLLLCTSIGRTISTKPNLTSYLHTFYYDITYCPNDDTNTT